MSDLSNVEKLQTQDSTRFQTSLEPIYAVVDLNTGEVYNGRIYTTKKRAYKELPRFQRHMAYRTDMELDIVEYIPKI